MLDAQAGSCHDQIVCFSHLRWNFVYQRPQHLLSRAGQHFRVLFIEEPIFRPGVEPQLDISSTRENVTVIVPILPEHLAPGDKDEHIALLLRQILPEAPNAKRVLWYYTPAALAFSRWLAASAVIYDNMDELSAFLGASPRLLDLEEELFHRADLVFTGGMSLYAAKRHRHPCVHAFPSSIDAAHFEKAQTSRSEPDDQAAIPRPRIGFFGVIDERMDIRLLNEAARLQPDWQFIMVGPVVKIEPALLPRRPNIHWLGPKEYSELPDYLAGWDAGFMPFAINEATRFISPTKTPEYLAAGVPVVSTPISDVVKPYGELGLVKIAHDAAELAARLQDLLRPRDPEWKKRVRLHLASMSWDKTWADMHTLIKAVLKQSDSWSPGAVTPFAKGRPIGDLSNV